MCIKYLNTGEPAVNSAYSPDHEVLYISADSAYFEEESDGNFVIRVPYECFDDGKPAKDTSYNIQVRFGSTRLWSGAVTGIDGKGHQNFSTWRTACTTAVPTTFGEWSNLMKAYCYGPATHIISYDYNDFMPRVKWLFKPSGDDPIEQVKVTYWYSTLQGVEMKTNVFSGQYQNDNTFSFETVLPIAPVKTIQAAVDGVTKNNSKWHDEIFIPSLLDNKAFIEDNFGEIKDMDLTAPEIEDGAIGKIIVMPGDLKGCKYFNVYRIETLTTKCLKIISK